MNGTERVQDAFIHGRRTRVLAETAARMLPPGLRLLDVGCGDGLFATILSRLRPDLDITGAEMMPRASCRIPVQGFDGEHLPFGDGHFDACLLIDVLHHTTSPAVLLRETARVSRGHVLLKDHNRSGCAAQSTLRFMDIVGNRRHGVPLPFHYLSPAEWSQLLGEIDLEVAESDPLSRLYPFPASLIFGRRLHFMALLRKAAP